MHELTVRNSRGAAVADRPRAGAAGPAAAVSDGVVLLADGESVADLRRRVARAAGHATRIPSEGLAGLAAALADGLAGRPYRAAVVAASPAQAATRLARVLDLLDQDPAGRVTDPAGGMFTGIACGPPRIGFLFPGQGSGKGDDAAGALARLFPAAAELFASVPLPPGDDPAATAIAQPRITRSTAAGLRVLDLLGIEASWATGHSLGELSALCWAGAMTEAELITLAGLRGQVMTQASAGGGAMAGIAAPADQVAPLLVAEPVVIAGYNGPAQTVISGPARAVERVRVIAAEHGWRTARVAVSHAFHSPAVTPAATAMAARLASWQFRPLQRTVVSTLTGDIIPRDTDLAALLVAQISQPVKFAHALTRMAADTDLLIEVGPGRILSRLAAQITPLIPAIPLTTDSPVATSLLTIVAAAHTHGTALQHHHLNSTLSSLASRPG